MSESTGRAGSARSRGSRAGAARERRTGAAPGLRRVSTLVLSCLLLAGCGPSSQPPGPDASSSSPPPGQLLIWADPQLVPALREIGDQYARATSVAVAITPVARAAMTSELAKLAPQGDGPDLFVGDSTQAGDLVAAGLVAPTDYRVRQAGFTRWSLDAFRLASTIYGMPFAGDGVALLRNAALAPTTPKTIEAMARRGHKLVTADKAAVPIGLPVGPKGDSRAWYPFYSAAGGYLFGQDSDGSFAADDLGIGLPGSVVAGRKLAAMSAAGDINPKLDHAKALALFRAGRCAYFIGDLSDARLAAASGVAVVAEAVPDFDDVPAGSAQGPVGYQGIYLSAFARDRDVASRFLVQGLATTAAMDQLYQGAGGQPAWAESLARAASDSLVAGFAAAAEKSGPAPNLSLAGVAWRELSKAQYQIIGGAQPAAAMAVARDAVEAARTAG